jgi:beta-lactam-binding protein with PASTA domain
LVVGQKLTDAESKVRKLGFKVASRSEENFDTPSGQVISQTPKSGTSAKKDCVKTVIRRRPDSDILRWVLC